MNCDVGAKYVIRNFNILSIYGLFFKIFPRDIFFMSLQNVFVEEHRSIGGSIISRLDNGAFVGLIYKLLVFS